MSGDISQSEIDALLKDMGKNNQIDKGVDQGVSGDREPKAVSLEADNTGPVVEKVEFAQLKRRNIPFRNKRPGLNYFNNIPLALSGELGKAVITVRDLLKLEEGSVIKLEKMVGESAAVLLNNQYLGQAEIVVINDRFGLRITSIGDGDKKETKHAREISIKEIKEAERQVSPAQSESAATDEGE